MLLSEEGTAFLCLAQQKDARDKFLRQNMMPRRLRARREQGKKKGRVTQEGGGDERDYASIGLD